MPYSHRAYLRQKESDFTPCVILNRCMDKFSETAAPAEDIRCQEVSGAR